MRSTPIRLVCAGPLVWGAQKESRARTLAAQDTEEPRSSRNRVLSDISDTSARAEDTLARDGVRRHFDFKSCVQSPSVRYDNSRRASCWMRGRSGSSRATCWKGTAIRVPKDLPATRSSPQRLSQNRKVRAAEARLSGSCPPLAAQSQYGPALPR